MNRRAVEIIVHEKLQQQDIDSLISFIRHESPNLWGEMRPVGQGQFVSDLVYLWLMKEIQGIGYEKLVKRVDFGYVMTKKSFQHNIQRVRELGAQQGAQFIEVGSVQEWTEAAKDCNLNEVVADTTLWMDSSDFPLTGRASTSRKHTSFSYKLNGPGQRYMVILDGSGAVKRLWGGYSPKQHDGSFLKEHKNEITDNFSGGVIIADNHFSTGKKIFGNAVKIYTNFQRRKDKKTKTVPGVVEETDEVDIITAQQEKFNRGHQQSRARVETPFGWVTNHFKSLDLPWAESQLQQDFMITFAFGIRNKLLQRRHGHSSHRSS